MSQHAVTSVVDGVTTITMADDAQTASTTIASPKASDLATVVALSPNSAPIKVNAGLNLNTSAMERALDTIKEALVFIRDNQTSTSQKTQVTNFPSTQSINGTVAVSGTVPVSGAFQATQPISAAALPLPSGASTEATLALIKAKTDNLDVALSTRTKPGDTQPVSGVFFQATQPVSGAFFQATQPISGSVSVSNLPATQPVSGTFFQTTQPISAAAMPLPPNSAQETAGNLATIGRSQELSQLAAMDAGRVRLSTRGCDIMGALFSERGSR